MASDAVLSAHRVVVTSACNVLDHSVSSSHGRCSTTSTSSWCPRSPVRHGWCHSLCSPDELSANALRVAAIRGRLKAAKAADGTWRSSRAWVDEYRATPRRLRSSPICTRSRSYTEAREGRPRRAASMLFGSARSQLYRTLTRKCSAPRRLAALRLIRDRGVSLRIRSANPPARLRRGSRDL